MKIGVFDSGVGGQSMAEAIAKALPEHQILLKEDRANLPYGLKTPQELLTLVRPIIQSMIDEGCRVIVVACNTVTTNIISELRKHFAVPFVAIEPMVKPAAEITVSNIIAVCATPATLNSERYDWLKRTYADGVTILEPDCSDWALMIEDKQIDQQKIEERIIDVLVQGADVVVLACTHYHWIEDEIMKLTEGKATVLQPEAAIIRQLKRVLAQLG